MKLLKVAQQKKTLFLSILLLLPVFSFADVYTYTDANGVVHVTSKPPKNSQSASVIKSKEEPTPANTTLGNGEASASVPDALPSSAASYDPILREASISIGVPLALLRAVCHSESAFNPYAVSPVGAQGLMQLMPATGARMGVIDPFDPRENIMGGARYLKLLMDRFGGDLVLVVAAYHAGEGAVERSNGVPPYESTHIYLKMVLSRYYKYKNLP